MPRPWWGPVLAPDRIAILLIVGGAVQAFNDEPAGAPLWPSLGAFRLSAVGVALSLSVFMADAIRAAGASRRSFRDPLKSIQEMRPVTFNWPLFLAACVLMELPAVALVRQYFARR